MSRQLYVSLEFKGEVSCEDIKLGVFNTRILKQGMEWISQGVSIAEKREKLVRLVSSNI